VSVGIFPVFKSRSFDSPFDPDEGVLLLQFLDQLDDMASESGLKPLGCLNAYSKMDLPEDFDGSPEWYAELRAHGEIAWHNPADAVATIDGLLESVSNKRHAKIKGKNREYVVGALEDLKSCLSRAVKRRVKFHFDVG
jgi:hypothetical protein